MTGEGKYVEVQGTAEHGAFDHDAMNHLLGLAQKGIRDSFDAQRNCLKAANLPAL
jgi:ribonuclease PH